MKRHWITPTVLLAVFLLVRLALLSCSSDVYYFPDELFMGVIARSPLSGALIPLASHLYHPHEGGTLVFGLSATPLFALLGESYFALKLAALAWSFAAAALWVAFARRYCGDAAASFTAFLWAFAPPNLVRLSLWATGTQPQCPLADILVITLFCAFLCVPDPAPPDLRVPKTARAAAWGIACGFALYFSLLTALSIAACLLCWLLDRRRSLRSRYVIAFLSGAALGLGPLIRYNIGTGFAGLSILAGGDAAALPATTLGQGARLFARMLLIDRQWMDGRLAPFAAQLFQVLYAAGFVAGAAVLLRRAARGTGGAHSAPPDPLGPVCAYLVIFPCFFILARLDRRVLAEGRMMVAYRYDALLYPFLIFAVAYLLARAWRSARRAGRAAAIGGCAVVAIPCLLSLSAEMRAGAPGLGFRSPGYSYFAAGWSFSQRPEYSGEPDKGLALAEMLPDPFDREEYLRGFTEVRWWGAVEGEESGYGAVPPLPRRQVRAAGEKPKCSGAVARRRARGTAAMTYPVPPAVRDAEARARIRAVEEMVRAADARYQPAFYLSLGRVLAIRYVLEKDWTDPDVARCVAMAGNVQVSYRAEVMRGIGQAVGSRDSWMKEARRIEALLPPSARPDYRVGLPEGRTFTYYHYTRPH